MTKGQLESAIRRALNIFDQWNDVAGIFRRDSGSYFEILSVIEDAVHCGAQAATRDFRKLESEPEVVFIDDPPARARNSEKARKKVLKWYKKITKRGNGNGIQSSVTNWQPDKGR